MLPSSTFQHHAQGYGQFFHGSITCSGAAVNTLQIQFIKPVLKQPSAGQKPNAVSPMPLIAQNNCKFRSAVDLRHCLQTCIADMPIRAMTNCPYYTVFKVQRLEILFKIGFCLEEFT